MEWDNGSRLEGALLSVLYDVDSDLEWMAEGVDDYGQIYCPSLSNQWSSIINREQMWNEQRQKKKKRKRKRSLPTGNEEHNEARLWIDTYAPQENDNYPLGQYPGWPHSVEVDNVFDSKKVCMGEPKRNQSNAQRRFNASQVTPYGEPCQQLSEATHELHLPFVPARDTSVEDGDTLQAIARRCSAIANDLELCSNACALCGSLDYVPGSGFTPRTMLICDQCEQEYHVGCLKEHKGIDLQALPKQDWFCSRSCGRVHDVLMAAVEDGEVACGPDTCMVVRGRHCTKKTNPILKRFEQILQECFDPIRCRASGVDLLAHVVRGESVEDWDLCGFYCMGLRGRAGHWVSALVFRVFGEEVAEVPLVATVPASRGQGYGLKIVRRLEALLESAGVQSMILPSADATLSLWTSPRFGFRRLDGEPKTRVGKLFTFPGTVWCQKDLTSASVAGTESCSKSSTTDWQVEPACVLSH
eukprot:evm.model.scf_1318.7 EVM.evm.TU.scf_1318.7   scf_1318:38073-43802(-)